MNREHMKAAAEAFAGVTPTDSACYHYVEDGYHPFYREQLHEYYLDTLLADGRVSHKYVSKVIDTALSEMTHPVINKSNYSWTGRQRSTVAGISNSTWHDNKLSDTVEFIINDIRSKSHAVWRDVQDNLKGARNPID